MIKDTLEETDMTRDLNDMKEEEENTIGGAVEMKDETKAGKKKKGKDTKKEEIETRRVRLTDGVIPGGQEEKDLDPKDQEEADPEVIPMVQENHQEDREVDQGTRSTPARGS